VDDDEPDTCARCGVDLEGPRVIVLLGSLAIMYCPLCGKKEAHLVTRSGTHAMDVGVKPKARTR
jgi:hypothetical protein